jgi:urease accessory protein
MNKKVIKLIGFASLLLAAPFAEAHTVLTQHSFQSGLLHPMLGLDHLLATMAVGIWAAKMGGRMRWSMPLLFIALLTVAAIWSRGLASVLVVENSIAVSLLLLGLFIAFSIKLPATIGMIIVGLFAIFHGVAHGTEWPAVITPFWYVSGFVFTTASLQVVGVMAATYGADRAQVLIRLSGMLIASAGGWILLTN